MPDEVGTQSPTTVEPKAREEQQHENEEEDVEVKEAASLTFRAPEALLRPFPVNPLRIFVSHLSLLIQSLK